MLNSVVFWDIHAARLIIISSILASGATKVGPRGCSAVLIIARMGQMHYALYCVYYDKTCMQLACRQTLQNGNKKRKKKRRTWFCQCSAQKCRYAAQPCGCFLKWSGRSGHHLHGRSHSGSPLPAIFTCKISSRACSWHLLTVAGTCKSSQGSLELVQVQLCLIVILHMQNHPKHHYQFIIQHSLFVGLLLKCVGTVLVA